MVKDKEQSQEEIERSGGQVDAIVSTFSGMTDRESVNYQIKQWVAGNPVHNPIRDECCPDFSCCNGKIASVEQRERFAKAVVEKDERTQMEMLGMFLGSAFSDEKIYVAGLEIPSEC